MSCCCYWIQTSRVLHLKHKTESSGMHNLYSLWSHGMSENLSDHVEIELRSVGMFLAEEEVGNLLVVQVKTFHTTHKLSVNCPSPFPRRTHLGHVPPLKLRLISTLTCKLGCSHEKSRSSRDVEAFITFSPVSLSAAWNRMWGHFWEKLWCSPVLRRDATLWQINGQMSPHLKWQLSC